MTTLELERRFGPGRIQPLAPDASTRAFYRVHDAAEPRIVMVDAAGGRPALDRLAAAHALHTELGVPVPKLLDRDDSLAALVFEDFGDLLLVDALPRLTADQQLSAYAEAGRIAATIARHGTPRLDRYPALGTPILGAERLIFELDFLHEHELQGRRGLRDAALLADVRDALHRLAHHVAQLPRQLAHRDFHARNLIWRGIEGLGVLDFQDTLSAPPLYDLASLIRDPYVEPAPQWEAIAAAAYAEATADACHDPRSDPAFAAVAAQRDLKAIGTYAYQATRLGRTRFLACIPVAERLVSRALDELQGEELRPLGPLLKRAGLFAS